MNSENLIEQIRKFPVLYDQSNDKYKNSEYKERVWKTISFMVEGEVDDCKRKWASIRDQLRRTLQKRKTKGKLAARTRKYKYEDNLTFLLPHLREMEGLTNVSQVEDDFRSGTHSPDMFTQETPQEKNLSSIGRLHTEAEKNLVGRTKDTNIELKDSYSPRTNQVSAGKDNLPATSTLPATKRRVLDSDVKLDSLVTASPASQLMAYILAEKEAEKEKALKTQTPKQHPVDAFLGGIAPTLKSLDAALLNEAKGKIFTIVHQLEARQLQLNARSHERYFKSRYAKSPSPSSTQSSPPSSSSQIITADEITNYNNSNFSNDSCSIDLRRQS